jgi:hypothetical protein
MSQVRPVYSVVRPEEQEEEMSFHNQWDLEGRKVRDVILMNRRDMPTRRGTNQLSYSFLLVERRHHLRCVDGSEVRWLNLMIQGCQVSKCWLHATT